jgi:hypothetical protein
LLLNRTTLVWELLLLPLAVAVRLRRGQVLRLGLAARSPRPGWYARCLRPLLRLSTVVRWRDTATGPVFGFGTAGPDWAFGWSGTDKDTLEAERADIVVSYRADRDPPSEAVLGALREVARDEGRRLVVVSHVRGDASRSADVAARLGAVLVPWPGERSLAEHEEVLRGIYRTSALVVSDRLHAVVLGMTEGAVPCCVTDRGETKIERHLDAVGFTGSTACAAAPSGPQAFLRHQLGRRMEALAATRASLDQLDDLTDRLAALSSPPRERGRVR